ncbi:AraC family transcriptional regulator [Chitinophaga sp. Cy-1792]|uniref:helix-turn-helix domain-containing protein n=1 Tax=Chitinophaga sp. Cy-1792 TaxID=2608339 RepID=UPI001423D143|nr:AraC family transcriptional regulator [Chitinophaga sp. Cy-1792]NIG54573.1 AraC family transcriptional regulator [Chitinophaga sp. Cy-1792]
MKKENLYEPFEVEIKDLSEGLETAHGHNFFELAYIVSGTGQQTINSHHFNYAPGHMFLITPEDIHSLEVQTPTVFFFLRFTDIYIQQYSLSQENIKKLEFILQNANHQPGCILKNQTDKSIVKPMVDAVIREYVNRDIYNQELIRLMVNTLIVIVARNITKFLPQQTDEQTDAKAMDILQYIRQHIFQPEKIRTEVISKHFSVSEHYLGRYFKKHTNETMQQFIMNYKLRMIEHRLRFSDMRISEIVSELGFTDESHLNRFFKKQKGVSPTAYRKNNRRVPLA